MARPKTGAPVKRSINLTIDDHTREQLSIISKYHGKSVSCLLAEWAQEEIKNIERTMSASNLSVTGKKKSCSTCKHFGSSANYARCCSCSSMNGYKHWEEKED